MDKLYIIVVAGCVDPEIHGPYASYKERLEAAIPLHQRDPDDAIMRLNIDSKGIPTVEAFSGAEMEGWEPCES